jgi:DNA polymerase-3 subunit delta'
VVVHPAERLNPIAANTLLKTLEEPPGAARFVLACGAPDALLPTIRSRCERLPLKAPSTEVGTAWLVERGVRDAAVLLAACGGEPLTALEWQQEGVDARVWERLPALIVRGESSAFAGWAPARVVAALQKLCHDAFCAANGATTRYFPAHAVPKTARPASLAAWSRELARLARDVDHPWNAGLLVEALVEDAKNALSTTAGDARQRGGQPVHSSG